MERPLGRLPGVLREGAGELLIGLAQPLAIAVLALFGGNRSPHRVDLLVVILAGVVAVIVWSAGSAVIAYRLIVVHEGDSLRKRWAVGVLALVVWTVGVVLSTDWILD